MSDVTPDGPVRKDQPAMPDHPDEHQTSKEYAREAARAAILSDLLEETRGLREEIRGLAEEVSNAATYSDVYQTVKEAKKENRKVLRRVIIIGALAMLATIYLALQFSDQRQQRCSTIGPRAHHTWFGVDEQRMCDDLFFTVDHQNIDEREKASLKAAGVDVPRLAQLIKQAEDGQKAADELKARYGYTPPNAVDTERIVRDYYAHHPELKRAATDAPDLGVTTTTLPR